MNNLLIKRVSLLLLCFVFVTCQEKVETIKPTIGNLTESIYASVTIKAKDAYTVYASASGTLENVIVEEGDQVATGAILAKIKANTSSLNMENASLSMELAKEKFMGKTNLLSSIKNEMEQLEEQVRLDSANYVRQQNLWNKNIGSRVELENRKLKLELGQKKRDGLIRKYKQTEIELENFYQQSQTSLKKAQSNLSDYTIQSKIDGKVYTLFKKEGERISPQEPFAEVGRSDQFVIEMRIDEVDIANVALNQKVLITLDAYAGQVFEGLLSKIYPQKDDQTQTFKVEAKFLNPPKVLYAGLSGEANIIFAQKTNVISIPIECLMDQSKVKTPDGTLSVETGIKTMDRIEILSGIDTSSQILKP